MYVIVKRISFAAMLLTLWWLTPAFAACAPGWGSCPDGGCAPLGSKCCANGKYAPPGRHCCADGSNCENGWLCVSDGKCLKKTSPRVCSNGTSYCDSGKICITGNKCLAVESERVCSDLKYCPEGFACTNEGTCLSTSSNRYCGGGKYCSEGYECAGEGKCRAIASFPGAPSTPPGTNSAGNKPPVSDTCLVVGNSVRVGGSIGECTKKDGSKSHYFMTSVRSSGAPGCPSSIEFEVTDPGDGVTEKWYTPFKVQTCGGPPVGVRAVGR